MKKLMIVAAAAALAGVASASNVFDYKASVKYVDFKQVKVQGTKCWVKTVKSTSLKGYLVTPIACACDEGCSARQPGFLVLTSSLAKKYDKAKQVKLMPANLLADMWSTKYLDTAKKAMNATLEAQGYLFAGIGKNATFFSSSDDGASPVYGFGDLDQTEATRYLFGQANISDVMGKGEDKVVQFIEPFLDAAGFGKGKYSSTDAPICGTGSQGYCLQSLKGSVIGGSWSCLANWFDEGWRCQGWDNEAIAVPEFDYTGRQYKYNVISGTWQIKANTKIEPVGLATLEVAALADATGTADIEVAEYVKACGQKLQKDFNLATFDSDGALPAKFVKRWFAPTGEVE